MKRAVPEAMMKVGVGAGSLPGKVVRASPVCFPQRQRVADDDCSQRGSPLHKKVTTSPTHTHSHTSAITDSDHFLSLEKDASRSRGLI